MTTIELTREETATVTEGAEKAYFETIQEMGRPFDHAELELFITLAVEGAQTTKFIKAYREEVHMAKDKHPATGNGGKKSGIQRRADKGVVPQKSRFKADPTTKQGQDTATRNARGFWAQQGGKAATGERHADGSKPHGQKS